MKSEEPKLYAAYGSNLNIKQMACRCPSARLCATGIIKDHELQFKGRAQGAFATIANKVGAEVPVAIWELQCEDEYNLDRYEGYPNHYSKKEIPVVLKDGRVVNAMVYIMNLRMGFNLPSAQYIRTVYQGYIDCELDTNILYTALNNSIMQFYLSNLP